MKYNSRETGLVFDIQRFSIHDGPGIRMVVFFKGCPLRCAWCQNPESIKNTPEIGFFRERCGLCEKCFDVCPEGCIDIHLPQRIDRSRCTLCGRCAEACSFDALRMIGEWYKVNELLSHVEKDRVFYEESGGGVTLSGGEPGMQYGFLESFTRRCKKAGLHMTMETCGYFNKMNLSGMLKNIDLILFDIKVIDGKNHLDFTGKGNKLILRNFSELASSKIPLIPRMPLVPGFTATPENVMEVIRLLKSHSINLIQLLPYHPMGESKLGPIESPLPSLKVSPLKKQGLEGIRRMFIRGGIDARII